MCRGFCAIVLQIITLHCPHLFSKYIIKVNRFEELMIHDIFVIIGTPTKPVCNIEMIGNTNGEYCGA